MTDEAIINILNYFSKIYPGVSIEIPKAREKSPKSILNKIKNLQIERLSKLYAIEGIGKEQKQEIYNLFKERVYENSNLKQEQILIYIKQLLEDPIENINIDNFINNVIIAGMSTSTKTALLRILVSKIEKSNLKNKDLLLKNLDEKYGKAAARKSGIPEKDIIRYSSIEDIRNTKRRMNVLHDEQYYLRSKDLRGAEIVIADFQDNFHTDNPKIKKLLEEKKKDPKNAIIYNHKCSIELGKDFIKELCKNKELLNKWGIRVMPYSIKYKKKTNGYEADHIKFEFLKNLDYSFELQIKSEYILEITKKDGIASHENRPGKERILPNMDKQHEFIKGLNFALPKYTTFRKTPNGYKKRKCNMKENMTAFYQSQLDVTSEEYERALNMIEREEEIRG